MRARLSARSPDRPAVGATLDARAALLLGLQRAAGNRAVSRLVGGAGLPGRRLQRRIDRGRFQGELSRCKPISTTLDRFLISAEWTALEAAIRAYDAAESRANLLAITVAVEAIDNVVISDFIDAFAGLYEQVVSEAGMRFLEGRHAAMPKGVNDATDLKASVENCAVIVAGAMTGKRAGEITKQTPGGGGDFFTDHRREQTGKGRADKFAGEGIFDDDQVDGLRMWITAELGKAGVPIGSVEKRGSGIPTDLDLAEAIDQMRGYPSGTQFAVGLAIEGVRRAAHWVYADNYGGVVTFFDFQRDRLYPLIRARETAAFAKGMSELEEKERTHPDQTQGFRAIMEAAGEQATIDTETDAPSGPKATVSPVIYDYAKDVVDPPAMKPNGVLYLAFRPALDEVKRLYLKVRP